MNIERIAQVAHEINRAYCQAIGDESQPTWEDAPDWQRNSARSGVQAHIDKQLTPRESHDLWMDQKVREGWIYGPVKDPTKKEHHCIVPYDHLPVEQRVKDYLFAQVVASLMDLP